jgi:hypothetical protein
MNDLVTTLQNNIAIAQQQVIDQQNDLSQTQANLTTMIAQLAILQSPQVQAAIAAQTVQQTPTP